MSSEYQIGKDIGELKAKLESFSTGHDHHHECNCKNTSGRKTSSQLTPENLRVLRLLHEKGPQLKTALEDVFLSLGIRPEYGEKFFLTAFSIIDPQDPAAMPMTPFGPLILACCEDGYDACFQIGCDPCAD